MLFFLPKSFFVHFIFCVFNFSFFLILFFFQSAISRLVLRPQWNTGVIRKSAPHSFLAENSVHFKNLSFIFLFWQSLSLVFLHNMDSFMFQPSFWCLILEFHSLYRWVQASGAHSDNQDVAVWYKWESGSKSLQKGGRRAQCKLEGKRKHRIQEAYSEMQ